MSVRLRDEIEFSGIDEEERSSYYGGASVPFIWESRPGTPKNKLISGYSFPLPLTPPPSYYSSGTLSPPKRQSKVRTKLISKFLLISIFNNLRKRCNISKKKANNVYGSSFSWSSTSSSSSFSSSPTSTLCNSNGGRKGFRFSMERALFAVPSQGSTASKAFINGDMNKA